MLCDVISYTYIPRLLPTTKELFYIILCPDGSTRSSAC